MYIYPFNLLLILLLVFFQRKNPAQKCFQCLTGSSPSSLQYPIKDKIYLCFPMKPNIQEEIISISDILIILYILLFGLRPGKRMSFVNVNKQTYISRNYEWVF